MPQSIRVQSVSHICTCSIKTCCSAELTHLVRETAIGKREARGHRFHYYVMAIYTTHVASHMAGVIKGWEHFQLCSL